MNKFSKPVLTRPSSAKLSNNIHNNRRGLRPNSARTSDSSKSMSFEMNVDDDEKDIYIKDIIDSDSDMDDSDSDESLLSDDEEEDDDEYEDDNYNESITAKDINVFRENINNGYMPKGIDIKYDGLLNE